LYEKTHKQYKALADRVKANKKKSTSVQRLCELRQEKYQLKYKCTQLSEEAQLTLSKTLSKHDYLSLEVLNNLSICYKTFFLNVSTFFETLDQEITQSTQLVDQVQKSHFAKFKRNSANLILPFTEKARILDQVSKR
jgi:hypothetical protein